jgi:hypothetical protein
MERPYRTDLTAKYNDMWDAAKPTARMHGVPVHALSTLGTRQANRSRLQNPDVSPFGAKASSAVPQIAATAFTPTARGAAVGEVPSACRTDDDGAPLSLVAEFEFSDSRALDAFAAAVSDEFTGAPVGPLSFILYQKRPNVLAWSSMWYNCDWVRIAQWYGGNARLVSGERQATQISWTVLGSVTQETNTAMQTWASNSPAMRVVFAPLVAGFVTRRT